MALVEIIDKTFTDEAVKATVLSLVLVLLAMVVFLFGTFVGICLSESQHEKWYNKRIRRGR